LGVLRDASHLSKEKINAKKSPQKIAILINRCRVINHRLRRPKHSKIEVVAPKEEEYDTVMNTASMTLPAVYHTSFTLMHQTSECQQGK